MDNQTEVRKVARETIKSTEYFNNWFGAGGFFNTYYETGILHNRFFVTRERFMSSVIYAAREITPEGINTLKPEGDTTGALESLEEALTLIEAVA